MKASVQFKDDRQLLTYQEIMSHPGFYRSPQSPAKDTLIYVNRLGRAFFMNDDDVDIACNTTWRNRLFYRVNGSFTISDFD